MHALIPGYHMSIVYVELFKNKCFGVVSDANFVNVNFVFLPLMSN